MPANLSKTSFYKKLLALDSLMLLNLNMESNCSDSQAGASPLNYGDFLPAAWLGHQ